MRYPLALSLTLISFPASADEPIRARCGTGDVQAWVTGNYADLVDLRHKSALIYRDGIRDGNGLNCSADVRVTEKYIIVRFGTSRDMVRLYAIEGKLGESPRFHFASFPWRDSANLADGHFPKLHPPPGRPPSRSLEKSLLGRQ